MPRQWLPSDMVHLNVGGQLFSTTVSTLTREESMLKVLLSGEYDVMTDGDGRVFIDRDGYRFRHILNYLRNGKLHLNDDLVICQEVFEEADYFGLTSLKDILEEEIEHLSSSNAEDTFDAGFVSSQSSDSAPIYPSPNTAANLVALLQQQTAHLTKAQHCNVNDDTISTVTQSQTTDYRFSLDEDF